MNESKEIEYCAVTIPLIDRKFIILTQAELGTINGNALMNWFKECEEHLLKNEDYEKMAVLRDAKIRYENQVKTSGKKS